MTFTWSRRPASSAAPMVRFIAGVGEVIKGEILVPPDLLPHYVHAGDHAAEDDLLRVHPLGQAFLGEGLHRLVVAQDQGAGHLLVLGHRAPSKRWGGPGAHPAVD